MPLVTDEEFAELVAGRPDLFFEMTAEGELIVLPPRFSLDGIRNAAIGSQLANWARTDGGGLTIGASGGLVLPNRARRSASAAWIPRGAIAKMTQKDRIGYWRLCPAFVVELRGQSGLRVLREKMLEWIANGAQLAWLIDPENRTVEIYRPNAEPELVAGLDSIAGEGPVAGFVLDLQRVWDPISTGLS